MNIKKRQKLKPVRFNFEIILMRVIESDVRCAARAAAICFAADVKSSANLKFSSWDDVNAAAALMDSLSAPPRSVVVIGGN